MTEFQPTNDIFFRCVEDCFEPIMITDTRGRMIYVNPAWMQTYGYMKEEVLGETPRLLRSKYQSDDFYQEMWRQILDPQIGFWRGELVNRAKDGSHVSVLLTITPYTDQNDPAQKILGYMGIAVDLTAKKELELKILQQDRLASIGQIASGIAHEVGTPLGVIRGRAELLAMQAESDTTIKRGLDVIIEQIDRISKLIRSFLNAARAPGDVTPGSIRINDVVTEVLNLTNLASKKARIEVVNEIPNDVLVLGSQGHLVQVLLNLVINAVHAIEKQREAEPEKPYKIIVSGSQDEKFAYLMIRDNGCGVSPENRSKLFQPFFTTKDIGKGTGLGLAISAQLITAMHGTLDFRSEGEGLGATITIKLPRG